MPVTQMMQQYLGIKEQNKDSILFFRLGDFYEMFFEDAKLVSRELELTLTGKDCGLSERAPMCGVPYHAADTYIQRLIEKGYKVAICEQMTDPALSKGLVEREVTRIVTPGTVIEANMLEEKKPSYIMSICLYKDRAGCAFADVSTGEFYVYQFTGARIHLAEEISRISPKEILAEDRNVIYTYTGKKSILVSEWDADGYEYARAKKTLNAHFAEGACDFEAFGKLGVSAAGALIEYLTATQKNALSHIVQAVSYDQKRYMTLDQSASANLELTQTVRGQSRKGSLLGVIDHTVTAMGSRMLRSWIERPLVLKDEIEGRLNAVEALTNDPMLLDSIRDSLSKVYDIERLLSKIAYETVNPHDCLALARSLKAVPEIQTLLSDASGLLKETADKMDPLTELADELIKAIDEDAPLNVKEGGIFKHGYSSELDDLREASNGGKEWINKLEQDEREATGIKNLKISYNRVFGYYIEVTKSFYHLVPYRYVRKQTLANCERFITEELKEIEKNVLGADERALQLEYQMFTKLRSVLKDHLMRLQNTATQLKALDALESLADCALISDYVRPQINLDGTYEITEGRHPVVEESIGREKFVPNDTYLNNDGRVMIITGPNMAGKSTYMRQVALIVLLAHIGSFVPAQSANIALTDRIFTRIGASDDLYGGQSTFMVEMNEMAVILKNATKNSLVILDEVGRGTSTFDGLSIAWAAVEHIASEKCGARTLFATHYHELSVLEGQLPGVVNYRVTAMEHGEDVIFLRKVIPGGEDRSYGVAVAKLAGLPANVISRARQIMARLEVDDEKKGSIGQSILDKRKNAGNRQISMMDFQPMELIEEIRAMDVMSMSPIDALNALYKLSEKARRI
ncbi:MAG: DNA mismatch repair protein MutS [Clostridia bacterium]|nr:DNA mismatch repair protein MutS [Clostridia bacterium]